MNPCLFLDTGPWLAAVLMPPADPAGYPLPAGWLQVLLNVTLTLHLMAMQFTLGSCLLYLWLRTRRDPDSAACARFAGGALPLGMSYLITLGIPPLLFTQVLYGQQCYSSSVLMADYWIQVVFAVVIAYMCFYIHRYTRDGRPALQAWLIGSAALLMAWVGFLYSNNTTLSMSPEKWLPLYQASPHGFGLNAGETTLYGRLPLFCSPAACAGALGLLFFGAWARTNGRTSVEDRATAVGTRWFVAGALAWFAALLLTGLLLPENVSRALLADPVARGLTMAAVLLFALGVIFVVVGAGKRKPVLTVLASLMMLSSLGCEVFVRNLVRLEYLAPCFSVDSVPVHAQWRMFLLFLACAVIGLGFAAWVGLDLLRQGKAPAASEEMALD